MLASSSKVAKESTSASDPPPNNKEIFLAEMSKKIVLISAFRVKAMRTSDRVQAIFDEYLSVTDMLSHFHVMWRNCDFGEDVAAYDESQTIENALNGLSSDLGDFETRFFEFMDKSSVIRDKAYESWKRFEKLMKIYEEFKNKEDFPALKVPEISWLNSPLLPENEIVEYELEIANFYSTVHSYVVRFENLALGYLMS